MARISGLSRRARRIAVRRASAILLAAAAALLVAGASSATPGALDPTFGNGGKVLTDLGRASIDWGADVGVEPDGKIVLVGYSEAGGFAVVRYTASGDLDPSFGSGGKVLTDLGATSADEATEAAEAVAIQPDGKIVVVGWSEASGSLDFALVRYLTDGSLDPGFGSGGKTLTDLSGSSLDLAFGVALQTDGKIVVAGYSAGAFPGSVDFALARYTPDGVLDPSFGTGGKVVTDFGTPTQYGSSTDYGAGLAIQQNGRIVVVGASNALNSAPNEFDFALARYLPDGSLDAGFGSGGKVLTDIGGFDTAKGVAIRRVRPAGARGSTGKIPPSSRIVVAGSSDVNGTPDFALVRYLPNGDVDASFAGGGKVLTDFGGAEEGRDIAFEPTGRIIVAGSSRVNATVKPADFALARYLAGGSLDASFGTGGKVLTNFGAPSRVDSSGDYAGGLVRQPNGKIVVGGRSDADGSDDFAVARYLGS